MLWICAAIIPLNGITENQEITVIQIGSVLTEKGKTMIELIIEKHDNGQLVPVQELVRCKDCKFNDRCELRDLLLNHEDGYCSDAEKKDT